MHALVLALAMGLAGLQQPTGPAIHGQVLSETTGRILAYARVEVLGVAGAVTYTDADGWYTLRGVPPGRRVVRASHVDHAPLEIEVLVPGSGGVGLEIALALRPVVLAPVRARGYAHRLEGADTTPLARAELDVAAARAADAGAGLLELGLASASGPGASVAPNPMDPAAALYVRGAASDLKLMLLDGAPVYTPFHLAGLVSPFEAGVLQSVDLYLGGAPARYDGGLSYVMDLETRSGRQPYWHMTAGVDMVSARVLVDGPIAQRATILASGRSIHGQGAETMAGEPFPYEYTDALARADLHLGAAGALSATFFHNDEAVRLDPTTAQDMGDGDRIFVDRTAAWGNTAGSVRYGLAIGDADVEATAATGTFNARLPVGAARPLVIDGRAHRTRFALDVLHRTGWGQLQYGAAYDGLNMAYDTRAQDRADPLWLRSEHGADVLGAYMDGRWDLLPQVQLRAGLRLDAYSTAPAPRAAPRFSARWLLTERAALTLAGGVYRQYMRAPVPVSTTGTRQMWRDGGPSYVVGTLDDEPGSPFSVARATHLTVQLDQELGDHFRLGVEGFYKRFERLPGLNESVGDAASSGFDVWTRRTRGRVVGWVGYSLSWIWATGHEEHVAASQFAGRHLLSAGVSGPLALGGGFELRLAYGAGLPYAEVPEPQLGDAAWAIFDASSVRMADAANREAPPLMSAPDDTFLRLDASVSRTWVYRRNGRGAVEITPYVKVLNALDRRDALFWYADPGGEEATPLASMPVLPIVGVEWKF